MPRHTHPILGLDPRPQGPPVGPSSTAAGSSAAASSPCVSHRGPRAGEPRHASDSRALIVAHRPRAIAIEKDPHPVPWLHELHLLTLDVRPHGGACIPSRPTPRRPYAIDGGEQQQAKSRPWRSPSQRFRSLRVYLTQDRSLEGRFWLNMFDAAALASPPTTHSTALPQPVIRLKAVARQLPRRHRRAHRTGEAGGGPRRHPHFTRMSKRPQTILGLDPGTRFLSVAVVRGDNSSRTVCTN